MIGVTLGRYRVLARIAAGGMGEVYRARDAHLERDVALKVLPYGLPEEAGARRRLRREALALSGFSHPHIATIHDFDEQNGIAFLVMELVDGETLESRLERGPLPEDEVRRIGSQIASALEAAHARGVIHRDLKPGNVMLTSQGQLKVLDFGLAKHLSRSSPVRTTTLTVPGAFAGTVPYAAPEQLLGMPVDARTDLFALGVTLYELATGRRPFSGENQMSLANQILNQPASSPRELRPELSEPFAAVILRCLEKRPDDRPPSATAVREALEAAATSRGDSPRRSRETIAAQDRRGASLRWLRLAVVAIPLVVTAGILFQSGRWGDRGAVHTLAVLPLANLSRDPEQEYFADGITEELIVDLSKIADLRVTSRTSSMMYKGRAKPPREVGRELGVEALVTGSVQQIGSRVRIRAQLVRAADDRNLWAESFEGDVSELLALQSRVARAIAERIDARIRPRAAVALARRSVDPEVHQHYLRGRYYWNKFTQEDWRRALAEFERAVELDPTYAPAYVGMSDAYQSMSGHSIPGEEAMPRARAAVQRALELDPNDASAHAALGYIQGAFEHDWKAAEASYRRALQLDPHAVTALQNYGYHLHVNGRFDEASKLLARAREIDPLSTKISVMTLWPLNHGRRYAETIAGARRLLQSDSTEMYPRFILAQALGYSGRHSEAIVEFRRVLTLEDLPLARAWLGWNYGRAGRRAEALAVLGELDSLSRAGVVVQPYCFALLHVALGNHAQALAWLERGVEDHTDEIVFIKVDPAWDPLRRYPQFTRLLGRIGLA